MFNALVPLLMILGLSFTCRCSVDTCPFGKITRPKHQATTHISTSGSLASDGFRGSHSLNAFSAMTRGVSCAVPEGNIVGDEVGCEVADTVAKGEGSASGSGSFVSSGVATNATVSATAVPMAVSASFPGPGRFTVMKTTAKDTISVSTVSRIG